MSINFSGVQGLTIPEGKVMKITDAAGRVLWQVSSGKVVLEVEKITSDTYAGETLYTGEQFIALDIYPKTNGTVNITYGGLTKTITDTSGAAEPNAQQVVFGTFNGVTCDTTSPESGTLTIEGDYYTFGCSEYKAKGDKYAPKRICNCITRIRDYGKTTVIPDDAFSNIAVCNLFPAINIPDTITKIGANAFYGCAHDGFSYPVTIGRGVVSIGKAAFAGGYDIIAILSAVPPVLVPYENEYDSFGEIYTDSETGETTDNRAKKIIVPKGCGDTYRNAEGWSYYADRIEEAT